MNWRGEEVGAAGRGGDLGREMSFPRQTAGPCMGLQGTCTLWAVGRVL